MPLAKPTFMPDRQPDLTSTEDVLAYGGVPGISFHKEGDGIIYFYDRPLLYVARYRGRLVVATLTDDAYEGPPRSACGWDQTFLVEVTSGLLADVHASRVPLRALYDQPGARTWFVHKSWRRTGERAWDTRHEVFDGVRFPEWAKPAGDVFLDGRVA